MAIQHRRGADVDFKAEKMLPGEIAVTIDGTRKVYAAFAPGDVKELASKEEVQKIVDNFENSVGEKINEAVQQVTDEATEQVEGIVAKGEEILNSIPVDYQETVKEVAQLKEDLAKTTQSKADAIICEAEGTTIVATDSSDAGFEGLSLYGKSKQGSTTGAQLWNGKYVTTVLDKEYDKFTHGTTMAGDLDMPITVGETYTFSINGVPTKMRYIFMDADGVGIDGLTNAITTVAAPDNAVYLKWRAVSYHEELDKCMLNAGTEPLPWELYTGNKPSPSPEYPQEVVSAGNGGSIEGKVCGKNLLKNTAITKSYGGITFTVNNDDSITCNGTSTIAISFPVNDGVDNIEIGRQYTISGCPINGSSNTYFLYFEMEDDNYITIDEMNKAVDYGKGGSATILEGCTKLRAAIFIRKGVTVSDLTFKPMIRLASIEDDTYEPYTEQTLTLQTPNGLLGMPLGTTIPDAIKNSPIHMAGVYWDNEEGQYYIADTVDAANGVKVQRIGCSTVTKGNTANITSASDGLKWAYATSVGNSVLLGMVDKAHLYTMNNKFTIVAQPREDYESSGTCLSIYGHAAALEFRFRLLKSEYPTEEDAANAINGTTVYYPLATPIEKPLSDEEILAYKALHTNKPTTTIMNSENVYMKAKYVADTKNHIKQNYIPLSKYTALEERVAAIEELVIS